MIIGDVILTVVNFLTVPVWHLVVLYILLFLIVVYTMIKSWGF
jgi:hypothetical protein